MKKLLLGLCLVISSLSYSQTHDGIGYLFVDGTVMDYDKQQHVSLGLFGGFSGYAIACSFTENRWERMLFGFAVGTTLGVLKETHDSRPGGTGFDWEDLAYTSGGSIVGAWSFDILNGGQRKKKAKKKKEQLQGRVLHELELN